MRSDTPGRLGFAALAIFSLPMVLIQTIEIGWRVYLPAFFATAIGLPLAAIGTLLLAVRLFDSAIDPVIAWASDQYPTRYGQRRPWIAASAPLIMLGALGVFFAAPGTSIAAVALPCLLLHLGYTMLATPHGGWALEIARDAKERIRVTSAKQWFAVAGMIATLLFTAWLERGLGLGRRGQTAAIGAILLILAPLCAILVVRHIREPAPARATRPVNPLRLFARILRADRVGTILLLYLFLGLGDAAGAATFLFFTESALQLSGWGSSLLLVQPIMAFIALPFWGWASQRIDKSRVLALVYGWQLLVVPLALLLPAHDLPLAILYLIARNAFAGVDYMLLRAMVADGAAADEAATGARNGASYYAAVNITLRIAMGVGAALPLWVLAHAGFAAGVGTAPAAGIGWTIRACHALPATIGALIGLLVLLHAERRHKPPRARLVDRLDTIPPQITTTSDDIKRAA